MHSVPVAARSRFHTLLALALAALVFAAFARSYYLGPLLGAAPPALLVHLHAVTFTGWLALFVVQAWLVASGRVRHHVRLGRAGAVLAGVTVVLGFVTVLDAAGRGRGRGGLSPPSRWPSRSPGCVCSPRSLARACCCVDVVPCTDG